MYCNIQNVQMTLFQKESEDGRFAELSKIDSRISIMTWSRFYTVARLGDVLWSGKIKGTILNPCICLYIFLSIKFGIHIIIKIQLATFK